MPACRSQFALFLAAAVLAVAGCGGDEEGSGAAATPTPEPTSTAEPVGKESAGSVVQFADCDDWNAGTREEKEATVDAIRDQLTPQSSETAESPLSDERAFEVFEKACGTDFGGSLRLYKLYARAQGFAPLAGD